jgi:hypothetical protein
VRKPPTWRRNVERKLRLLTKKKQKGSNEKAQ